MSGLGRLRLGLWVPWALFALAALGWFVYWRGLEARYAAQLRDLPGLSFQKLASEGFPFRLAFRAAQAGYAPAGLDLRLETGEAMIAVNPIDPRHLIIGAQSPLRIVRGDGTAAQIWGAPLVMSVRATPAGAQIVAEAAKFKLALEGGAQAAAAAEQLTLGLRPDPRDPARRQASITADHLAMNPSPFGLDALGPTIARLQAMTSFPADDPDRTYQVEGLAAEWGGARFSAVGTLSLDAQNRPDGALDLTVQEARAPLEALARMPGLEAAAKDTLLALRDGAPAQGPTPAQVRFEDGALHLVIGAQSATIGAAGPAPVRLSPDPSGSVQN